MRILDTRTPATIAILLSLLHGCDTTGRRGAPETALPKDARSMLTGLLTSRPIQNDPIDLGAIVDGSPLHVGRPFRVCPCTMDINAPATIATGFKEGDYSLLYYPVTKNGFTVCALLTEQEAGESRPVGYGFTDFIQRIERTYAGMQGTRTGKDRTIFHIPEFGLYFFRDRGRIISPFDNSILGIRAENAYDIRTVMSAILARMVERSREQLKKSMTAVHGLSEWPVH